MHRAVAIVLVGSTAGLAAMSVQAGACFLSVVASRSDGAAEVRDGKDVVALSGVRLFDDCARVVVTKGVVRAQYLDRKGQPTSEELSQGKGITVANISENAAPVRAVARSLMAVLTEPRERSAAGQKFFDKPAQVGAPFGDVYVPREGLPLRFVNLEGEARVQIVDAASNAIVLDTVAARGMTLDRTRLRAGRQYGVRVSSPRGNLPPGAFEVVARELSDELDRTLQAIDADPQLDAGTRAIARAIAFEREGLSFNREIALREMKR